MTNLGALKCWVKIQHYMKWAITGWNRFNFPCDSHPSLCFHCIRFRHWVSTGKLPNVMFINTSKGVYYSFHKSFKVTTVKMGQPIKGVDLPYSTY